MHNPLTPTANSEIPYLPSILYTASKMYSPRVIIILMVSTILRWLPPEFIRLRACNSFFMRCRFSGGIRPETTVAKCMPSPGRNYMCFPSDDHSFRPRNRGECSDDDGGGEGTKIYACTYYRQQFVFDGFRKTIISIDAHSFALAMLEWFVTVHRRLSRSGVPKLSFKKSNDLAVD